jgi:hypothetical protein
VIFDPKIFYQTYQKNYHRIKANYIKKYFDQLERKKKKKPLTKDEVETRRTLQIDLRQTYFHAIETFFELFFALNPKGKTVFEDEKVLFRLTNSDWKKTFNNIEKIAEDENALDFLKEKIDFKGHEITIGQYLFYCGIFSKEKFEKDVFDKMDESIDAIAYGMKIIAKDFIKREEYNAYKHGLRIIPSVTKMKLVDAETRTKSIEFDIADSMSFYMKTKNPSEIVSIAKTLDTTRDFYLTLLCSEFIHHLIYFRKLALRLEPDLNIGSQIEITFFGKDIIEKSAKINTQLPELKYTVTKNDNGSW